MIRYGILGFGLHARKRLIPAFAAAKDSRPVGLWRRDEQKAATDAAELNLTAFPSPEALCSSPEVDAIFVTSPDSFHLEHVLVALRHGKHVLCEKPLAMNSTEAEIMHKAAQSAGVHFGVAQNMRYNQSLTCIRQWIAEGLIGTPQMVNITFCHDATQSPRIWISNPELACGGPVADIGIHAIDALRYVLGHEVTEVSMLAHRDSASGAVESHAALSLALHSGAMASILLTTRARYRTCVEVTGSTGSIVCENALNADYPIEVVLGRSLDGIERRETVSNSNAYSLMLDSFSCAIEGKGAYRAEASDGLRNQRILDAAYASWRTGKSIQLQSIALSL